MSKPLFSNVSMRYSVPFMVAVTFMAMILVAALFDTWKIEQRMILEVEARSVDTAAHIANLVERDLAEYPSNVEQELMLQAARPHGNLVTIAVISPDARVLFAQRADWANRSVAEVVPTWDATRFAHALKGAVPEVAWDASHRSHSVLMPYRFPRSANEFVSTQRGVIYLEYDIAAALAQETAANRVDVLRNLLIALLLAALLAYWLHQRMTVPLGKLSQATQRMGQGDLRINLSEIGSGEIRDLANSLQAMEEQLLESQKVLEQQRGFLKTLIATLPDLIWLKDPKGIYLACNPRFEEFFGHSEAEIIGKSDYHFVPKEQADFFRQHDIAAMEAGKPCKNEEELMFASDGHLETVEVIKTPMYGADGELIGVLGMSRDISGRIRDALAVKKSEATLQAILSATEDGLLAVGSAGQVLLTNAQFVRLWQIPLALLDARNDQLLLDFVLSQLADPQAFMAEVERLYHSSDTSFDTLYFKDGRVFERYSCPLSLEGERTGRVWSFRDVTARKQAEAAIQASETRFRQLFNAAPLPLVIVAADGTIREFNQNIVQTFGYSIDDIPNLAAWWPRAYPDADYRNWLMAAWNAAVQQAALAQTTIAPLEVRVTCKSGEEKHLITNGALIGDSLLVSFFDISERKQAERLLLQERNLFMGGPAVAYTVYLREGFPLKYVSPNVLNVFGYAQEEVLQPDFRLAEYIHPEDFARISAELEVALTAGQKQFEQHYRLRHKDGSWRWVADLTMPIYAEEGTVEEIRGYLLDRTEQHQVQEELRIQSTYRQALLDNFPFMVWLKDTESRFLAANRVIAEAAGVATPQELLGKTDTDFWPAELASAYITDDHEVVVSGKSKNVEEPIEFAGQPRRWFETYKSPVRDGEVVVGTVGFARDITERKVAGEALRRESERNEMLLRMASDGIHILSTEGDLLEASESFCQLLGYSRNELIGQNVRVWDAQFDDEELKRVVAAQFKRIGVSVFETRHRRKDGVIIDVEVTGHALQFDQQWVLFNSSREITERKRVDTALRESESRFHAVFDGSIDGILVADAESKQIVLVNRTAQEMLGYSSQELLGMKVHDLHPPADLPMVLDVFERRARGEHLPQAELPVRRKDGSVFFANIQATQLEMSGRPCSVGFFRDITEHRAAQDALQRLAYIDALTGLPNRVRLIDLLDQALQQTKQSEHYGVLLKLNVDRFKTINDAAGHALGDGLLEQISERLTGVLQESDVLVRLVSDAFGILLSNLGSSRTDALQQAQLLANRLHVTLSDPFWLGEENHKVTASLGMTLFPEGAQEQASDVLRKVMLALHRAKQAGGDQTVVYEGRLDVVAKQRFQLEHEMRTGIAAGEFRLYLQPQVDAAGRTVGAEALVRWQHPQRGLVPPMTFIPIAEETDLIIELEEWVMSEVCHLLTHPRLASRSMRIAVNVSPCHFRRVNFVSWLKELLASSGVDPAHLMLEVTEGLVIENVAVVIAKMAELTALGIHFSVDDFGTGYSSLAYLRRLPLHELKIDKTFVQDAPDNPEGAALVEAILAVAKHLHLRVVAEGVETVAQAEFLNARATVIHQGYLFGKPDVAERFLARLAQEDKEAQ